VRLKLEQSALTKRRRCHNVGIHEMSNSPDVGRPCPCLISCAALLILTISAQAAAAGKCPVAGPRYWLTSDTVDWSLKIGNGESCTSELRFSNVTIQSVTILSKPQFGQLNLSGPNFTYSAKPNFVGNDFFVVAVTGAISRSLTRGSSTIRFSVSVGGSVSHDRTLAVSSPIDNTLPRPEGKPVQPCPTWDWSKGAPPPMRPPFDRSKLYCPPPPFKPPNEPIGCTCQ
jgi:hypothetical protein